MPWSLPNLCHIYYDDANWLDDAASLALFARIRFDNEDVGKDQYILSHRGATDRWSIRKNTANKFRASVVTALDSVTKDSVATITYDQVYTVASSWKKSDANGLRLWIDGAEIGSGASTTVQTANYNTGGSVDFYLGAASNNNAHMEGTLEAIHLWKDFDLTTAIIAQLHKGYRWWQIGGCQKPDALWEMSGHLLTRIPDLSGNGRHIEAGTIDTSPAPTAAPPLGIIQPRMLRRFSRHHGTSSQGSPPNPWVMKAEILHPVTAWTSPASRTNGQAYEYVVTAVDQSGNESAYSTMVEVTPTAPAPSTPTGRVPWLRTTRKSKYRSSQQ